MLCVAAELCIKKIIVICVAEEIFCKRNVRLLIRNPAVDLFRISILDVDEIVALKNIRKLSEYLRMIKNGVLCYCMKCVVV